MFPAAPNRLEIPALHTAVDTALQADWMLASSWVRSPGHSRGGYRRADINTDYSITRWFLVSPSFFCFQALLEIPYRAWLRLNAR